MLKDSFGRIHDYLRISLTDKCNLRCQYCMPPHVSFLPGKNLLSKDEILAISNVFVKDFGINKIRLTGGEPLLRKDARDIIESISQLPVELAITTNGVLLDQFFELFRKIGLQSMNISLDSLDPIKNNSITRRPYFKAVKNNIRDAIDLGFNVKVNMVVIKGVNDDEICDFVHWTKYEPIHIRFVEFMPFDGNSWNWNKVVSYKEIIERVENEYRPEKLKDNPNSTSKAFRIKGFAGTFAVISSITSPFCGDCNRIRLTADGKLKNCLFAHSEVDLLSQLRTGGDIKELIIQSIQNKAAERGGLTEFDSPNAPQEYEGGRSMIAIGG